MKDNFSRQAAGYAKYRPNYPPGLFAFIFGQTDQKIHAWDCATGNGQSAKALATRFEKVFATDISQKQIDHADHVPNIYYSVQPATMTDFAADYFDLITVSQALHWFAIPEFYREASRVARNGAIVAAWCYSLLTVSPEIDGPLLRFYRDTIGPYWDAERKYVDEAYQTILFPFEEITTPAFSMQYRWSIEDFEGYLNTWSAVQNFIVGKGTNPVDDFIEAIRPIWTRPEIEVRFPIYMRMGRVKK